MFDEPAFVTLTRKVIEPSEEETGSKRTLITGSSDAPAAAVDVITADGVRAVIVGLRVVGEGVGDDCTLFDDEVCVFEDSSEDVTLDSATGSVPQASVAPTVTEIDGHVT
eukprot:Opistho-2@35748